MIKYVKGDLFEAPEQIIAHGVNCKGAFGAGVAGIVAKKYPKAREFYLNKYKGEGWKLWDVQAVLQPDGKYILNCATQHDYGSLPNKVYVDYLAIEKVMYKIKKLAKIKKMGVAIPKIGAGLANGDWSKIEKIIEKVFKDYDITIYVLEEENGK